MNRWLQRISLGLLFGLGLAGVGSCGGGGGGSNPAGVNTPPQPVIDSPAAGTTFRAGDTLTIALSATDARDGALAADRLAWSIELHHDTHEHPFRLLTVGAGATVTIPTRGETSDNIFYRLHARATDSDGASTEIMRDLLPQKSQVTLGTQPSGLALALDGQPVTAPHAFTGVVGTERDLGAAAEQIANGRRYRFASWSDGGAASHTIDTPSADTQYVATFTDAGPAFNRPPSVSVSAPASATVGAAVTISATAGDADGSVTGVQFFVGSSSLGSDAAAPFGLGWTPSAAGTFNLTALATDDRGAGTTSTAVSITVSAPHG